MKIPVFLIDSSYEILSLNENGKTLLSEYKKSVRKEQNLKVVLKNDPILFDKIERMFLLKIDNYTMSHQVDAINFEISSNFLTIEKKKYGIFFFRDITVKATEEDSKKTFLANVAHELRTPLTAATTFAEILAFKDDLNAEEIKESSKYIYDELKRLGNLVADLSDITKYDQGEMNIVKTKFSIKELVFDIEKFYSVNKGLNKKNVKQVYSSCDKVIYADYNRLKQVFINIIDNAFMYTEDIIEVKVVSKGDKIRINFRDNGCGISYDQQEKLFDRFYRTDESRQRNKGGTGLGLSIVKEIVQLHGGNIYVHSELDKGTEFLIELPIKGE